MRYPEVSVYTLFLHLLSFLAVLRSLGISFLSLLHLSDLHDTHISTATLPESHSVVRFRDLAEDSKSVECAVCLNEFSGEDEIRCMTNCKHIFHKTCVDDQKTCPVCEYDDDVALFSQHDDDHLIASL